ncbi:MAG: hypothetical protein ACRDGD_07210 [Candidatus Limnocylindria bacterium]
MARRPTEEGRFNLSPRARRIGGWVVAALLIGGIAVVVRVLGGDGTGVVPGTSPSASGVAALEIHFGTALDATSGEVADAARTDRFASGDSFVYSVRTEGTPPAVVYVEVERTGGGDPGMVQTIEDGEQELPDPSVIAFTVPADNLFEVFGAGEYLMRIYAEPTGAPLAEGSFELVSPVEESPATS